jgi:hypothetical protein
MNTNIVTVKIKENNLLVYLTCPSLQYHKPFWKDILTINTFCKTPILNSIDTVNIKHPIYGTLYL